MPMPKYRGLLPKPTPESQPYWDGLRRHELCLPYCAACDVYEFYPRPFCRRCFSWDVEWRQLRGSGTLYSYAINYRPAPGFEDQVPYVIAVVELDEGPRMMTNLLLDVMPEPGRIPVGAPVTIVYDDVTDEVTLPRFRLQTPEHGA